MYEVSTVNSNSMHRTPRQNESKDKEKEKSKPPKEGSTHLPKFPAVSMATDDLLYKEIDYSEVPKLR